MKKKLLLLVFICFFGFCANLFAQAGKSKTPAQNNPEAPKNRTTDPVPGVDEYMKTKDGSKEIKKEDNKEDKKNEKNTKESPKNNTSFLFNKRTSHKKALLVYQENFDLIILPNTICKNLVLRDKITTKSS